MQAARQVESIVKLLKSPEGRRWPPSDPWSRGQSQKWARNPAPRHTVVPSARSTGHQGHAVGADLIFEPASLPIGASGSHTASVEERWWRGPKDREGVQQLVGKLSSFALATAKLQCYIARIHHCCTVASVLAKEN
ncbi:hypothetical protein VTN77DRAFT_9536 [Rasamsonia byssochlamydoides]|uniref:uncharacterized protein n=1 Tax=Rasamsonia byssochlamydoides TaxID=89139 RepID=UPI0037438744